MHDLEKATKALLRSVIEDTRVQERARFPWKWKSSIYVIIWMICSCAITLHNKFLLDTSNFKYPYLLTTWHLAFATLMTQLIWLFRYMRGQQIAFTITRKAYSEKLLPIAALFSVSLVLGNKAYLYLSVASIQMLKAMSPATILLVAWSLRLSSPNLRIFIRFTIVVFGCLIVSFGDAEFNIAGIIYQVIAILSNAFRVNLSQALFETNMDGLTCLYYFAPTGTIALGALALTLEVPHFHLQDLHTVSVVGLLLNAMLAFGVTVSTFFVLQETSALTLSLCGILRDILLIFASTFWLGTSISTVQVIGYSIAVLGLLDHALLPQKRSLGSVAQLEVSEKR